MDTTKGCEKINPIKLDECDVANKIDQEPSFKWWDGFVLRKINIFINKVKKNYWKTTHKFVLRFPKSISWALKSNKENGNDLWEKAIKK